jgi:hypothetical protein
MKYALVHTQNLENYGDAESPFWKFKGGSSLLIKCEREQDAFGYACRHLALSNRSREEYPKAVVFFATEEEAIASLEEWEEVERV